MSACGCEFLSPDQVDIALVSRTYWKDNDLNKRERFECTRGHVLNGPEALASSVASKTPQYVVLYTTLC